MKILRLRFRNLNSLAGEWSINFTAQEYVNDGIFAITGPTGAGKSTILDAICLALYGRTPRLKDISKSGNEIMSRQTSGCFSEVEFETSDGKFRAFWSQRRAFDKADGNLQKVNHELSEVDSGRILTSDITSTAYEIECRTGMNYERFVQAMMLAQGGFARFLQASANERAPILEQITGTEIYSRISKLVFEKTRDERMRFENSESQLSGINLLSEEEELQSQATIKEIDDNIKVKGDEYQGLADKILWLQKVRSLSTEIENIIAREKQVIEETELFKPERLRLQNAGKALVLEGDYAALKEKRNQKLQILSLLEKLENELPGLVMADSGIKTELDEAVKNVAQVTAENADLIVLTRKVRQIDTNLKNAEDILTKVAGKLKSTHKENDDRQKKISDYALQIDQLKENADEAIKYLEAHPEDASLENEIKQLELKLDILYKLRKDNIAAEAEATKLKINYKQAEAVFKSDEIVLKNALEIHNAKKDEVVRASRVINELLNENTPEVLEERREYLRNRLAELKKISDFDTERSRLEDGKPCPVCGSFHHPWAEGNIPEVADEEKELKFLSDLIDKYSIQAKLVTRIKDEERDAESKMLECKRKKDLSEQTVNNIKEKYRELSIAKEDRNRELQKYTAELAEVMIPFGIQIPEDAALFGRIKDQLAGRLVSYKKYSHCIAGIDDSISVIEQQINTERAIIEKLAGEIIILEEENSVARERYNAFKDERVRLFADKDPDAEERTFNAKLQNAEAKKISVDGKYKDSRMAISTNQMLTKQNQGLLMELLVEIKRIEEEFFKKLTISEFIDEQHYISCRLDKNTYDLLEKKSTDLNRKQNEIAALKEEKSAQFKAENIKQLTTEQEDKLVEDLKEVDARLQQLMELKGGLKQKLESNNEAKNRSVRIREEITRQKEIYEKWHSLSSLIGSADGKKYRNFAQGLTLEVMISYANSQLCKLSDRYLLIRDKNEPLEINVIDNYQAGEIRTTKNLSGGETFLVSMALALGLSRMAGNKIKVDSLFLDEGFDTLDEETLETALGTLANLKQDGKTIGVISHVGALKERINTKITVTPVHEGKSIISGPGCECLQKVAKFV